MKNKLLILSLFLLTLSLSLVSAEYSLDIKTDKQFYSSGEKVIFNVILLENSNPVEKQVDVLFSDNLEKKQINTKVASNKDTEFLIEENYPGGVWKIHAVFETKEVTRIFEIKEKQDVEFKIESGKLVITNKGNIPYTEEIDILIGEKVIPYKMNIAVGKSKEMTLVAPEGNYDIQVTDGETTLTQKNVHLTGTAQVIGALDEDLTAGSPLGGARDPAQEDKFFSTGKNLIAFVFVGAVLGLGILLFIERRLKKKIKA